MATGNFKCIRCFEVKSNPADQFGAPIYMKLCDEYQGICIDCEEKIAPDHMAAGAFDELSVFANDVAATFDRLDNLSHSLYTEILWGQIDRQKPKEKEELNHGSKL